MDHSRKISFKELRRTLAQECLNVDELTEEEWNSLHPPAAEEEAPAVEEEEEAPAPAEEVHTRLTLKGVGFSTMSQARLKTKLTINPMPFTKVKIPYIGAATVFDPIEFRVDYAPGGTFDGWEHVTDVFRTQRSSSQLAIVAHPIRGPHASEEQHGILVRHSPLNHRLAAAGWSVLAFDAPTPLTEDGDGEAFGASLRAVMAYVGKHRTFKYCRCALLAQGTGATAALREVHRAAEAFPALKVLSACQPSGEDALLDEVLGSSAPPCKLPTLVSYSSNKKAAQPPKDTRTARQFYQRLAGPKAAVEVPDSYQVHGKLRRFDGATYLSDHPRRLIPFLDAHSQGGAERRRLQTLKPSNSWHTLKRAHMSTQAILRPPSRETLLRASASMPILQPLPPIDGDAAAQDGEVPQEAE